jgi:glycine hydroxymethyltransferase
MSGMIYKAVHYTVRPETGLIDMDQVRDLARTHRPRMIVCGFSAYPRTLDFAAFRSIADEVGAIVLADIAHIAGLVCTGYAPSPVPHCQFVTTTTHKTLRGPRGGMIMADKDWTVPMNKAVFPGTQGGPLEHVIAGKAVAFGEALKPEFKLYAGRVVANAKAMADRLMARGLTLVSGGTDNHLMLLDLGERLSGKDAEDALGRSGITTNKNTVPGDKRSPFVTSGIRVGTPAMTTRGMQVEDAVRVADLIADVLDNPQDGDVSARVKAEVHAICARFPVYNEAQEN